jgi:predicted GIY-YIG superfamily endonuclease
MTTAARRPSKRNLHSSRHWHLNARRTAVYRLYDRAGALLYVGITTNPQTRFRDHENEKFWWHLVAREEVRWYSSRPEAEDVEGEALTRDHPRFDSTARMGSGWRVQAREEDPYWPQVAEALARDLTAGVYAPGEKLPSTRALAQRHAVSMCSVRTAFRHLGRRQVVQVRNGVAFAALASTRPEE